VAAWVSAENWIQKVRLALVLLLAGWLLPAQDRFGKLDRDLTRAAAELRISDWRAEVRESGHLIWKRGALHAPACTGSVDTQEVAGSRVQWWFESKCLTIQLPEKRLEFRIFADSTSLTEAARLGDGNILRSPIALVFFKDVAGQPAAESDELIDRALTGLYFGQRETGATLARQALDKFPELESTPDATLLYLFSELGLPETEASATAVIKAHPSLPTAWFYYGQYLENQKRYREAAACFEKITMHEPPWHNWTVEAAHKELTHLKTY
jgi:tetratricopeptide (TPR) repeat protein